MKRTLAKRLGIWNAWEKKIPVPTEHEYRTASLTPGEELVTFLLGNQPGNKTANDGWTVTAIDSPPPTLPSPVFRPTSASSWTLSPDDQNAQDDPWQIALPALTSFIKTENRSQGRAPTPERPNTDATCGWVLASDTLPDPHVWKIATPLQYTCPGCGQSVVSNGRAGFTPITPQGYGRGGWICQTCGMNWQSGINRPRPVEQGYRLASDYYHVAPTTERARIQQHGLQPSLPLNNERWHDWDNWTPKWLRNQPEGVYVTDSPTWHWAEGNGMSPNWDIWRVPENQVQELHEDHQGGAKIIPHAVYPELHAGGPETYQEPPPLGPDPHNWVDYHDWHGLGNPSDEEWKQWGIGKPTHVWGKTADQITQDTRNFADPSEPRASMPPSQKGCTCQWGDKLNCPVHGLNADPELAELDHSWSLPENNPVGYPQDSPRGWTQAVSSLAFHRWFS